MDQSISIDFIDRKEWRQNGVRHRLDGPAVIWNDGSESWYQKGLLHRLDGPAVIWNDGSESWYQKGLLHRENGPAIIWENGAESWWQNGKLHRLDGPAVIQKTGNEIQWWIRGNNITTDLEKSCRDYDISFEYTKWKDREWVWFRLWISQFP